MTTSITREAALRVALAARALGGVSPTELVAALVERLQLPLTETKLAGVTVADLQAILQGDDVVETGVPKPQLKEAVRLLWGEGVAAADPGRPATNAYAEGDMPGSIRVACAANGSDSLDGHFGSCEHFLVYQVSPAEARLIDVRATAAADAAEDRNVARAALIADCQVVYVQSIGGPATAKVVRAGIHPVKVGVGAGLVATLDRLREALQAPPPWLARVMGVEASSLSRFVEAASADLAEGEAA